MTRSSALMGAAASRLAVGVFAWTVPGVAGRAFGLPAAARDPFMGRLFAARDVTLGLSILDDAPTTSRKALQLSIAVDVADLAAAAIGVRTRRLPVQAALLSSAAALSTAVLAGRALTALEA